MATHVQRTKATDPRIRDMLRSPEEKAAEEKSALLRSVATFERTGRGRYKLELFLGAGRGRYKAYPGMLTFWESGTQLHGGGDVRVYLCPDPCKLPIDPAHNQYGIAVCQKCGVARKAEDTVGEIMGRQTTAGWAQLLDLYFKRFGSNCDIYLKYSEGDLRAASDLEQDSRKYGGELLRKAEDMELVIYPLRNILKDSQFTDVLKCFTSFLKT